MSINFGSPSNVLDMDANQTTNNHTLPSLNIYPRPSSTVPCLSPALHPPQGAEVKEVMTMIETLGKPLAGRKTGTLP